MERNTTTRFTSRPTISAHYSVTSPSFLKSPLHAVHISRGPLIASFISLDRISTEMAKRLIIPLNIVAAFWSIYDEALFLSLRNGVLYFEAILLSGWSIMSIALSSFHASFTACVRLFPFFPRYPRIAKFKFSVLS
jgi:hypothetical protein